MTESRRERYIRLLNSKSDLDIVGITHDAVRELIEVLEEPERKWIPCSERLPDTTDFVLTINIVSQCGVYRFDGDCWLDYDGLFVNEGIRAWMPLPEPI